MTTALLKPQVDLTFTDITAEALHHVDQSRLGTPEEVIRAALMSYRLLVVNHVKMEISNSTRMNSKKVLELIDGAGALYLKRFNRMVGPVAAASYLRAYQAAGAGDVPMSTIYALAEQHTAKMGMYFNETSSEAMVQGFNTYVNQRVPQRVAAERALDAFGLTPRQMSGYTSTRVAGKISSAQELSLRGKIASYINRSLHDRLDIFATQEAHNLDQQAQQTAWMWLQNKGAISEVAEKVWLTARDERVCPECGPMHGKRVSVTARFKMPSGGLLYVPGAHPRCRCEARLVDPMQLVRKDLRGRELFEFNDEHPRDGSGRFSAKARAAATLRERADRAPTRFVETLEGDRPSANLERMVAEAERLRGTTPVIEEAPPSLSMKTSAPSMGSGLSMGSGPSMQKPLQMRQSLSMAATDPKTFVMGGAQKPSGEMNRTVYVMPEQEKLQMIADTRKVFDQIAAQTPTVKQRLFRTQTLKLDTPVYAVVDRAYTYHGESINLTHDGTEFTPDESHAAIEASKRFTSLIEEWVTDFANNDDGKLTMDMPDGSQLEAVIDDDTIKDVVSTVAYMNGGDPDWSGLNVTHTVYWQDVETGEHKYAEKLTYKDIADKLRITPADFEVYVLRLTEGHDSPLGHTYQESWASHGAYTTYTTMGPYTMEASHRFQVGTSAPIHVMDLIPDAEMEEIVTDDWKPKGS